MAQVYSERFIAEHAGSEELYTVPAGYRAVIRCITSFNGSALINEISAVILVVADVTLYQVNLGPNEWETHDLRIVVNPGEAFTNAGGDDIDITVSGYLLTLP